jgi:hypothetical protein
MLNVLFMADLPSPVQRHAGNPQPLVYASEFIRFFALAEMPMMTLGVVVIVKHCRRVFPAPDESQPVADAFTVLAANRHFPNRCLVQVPLLIGSFLTK